MGRPLRFPGEPEKQLTGHRQGVDVTTGNKVFVRRVDNLNRADDRIDRVRRAISVAITDAVVSCPTVAQLVGYADESLGNASGVCSS